MLVLGSTWASKARPGQGGLCPLAAGSQPPRWLSGPAVELSLRLTLLSPHLRASLTRLALAPRDLGLAWHCQPSTPPSQRRECCGDWDTPGTGLRVYVARGPKAVWGTDSVAPSRALRH